MCLTSCAINSVFHGFAVSCAVCCILLHCGFLIRGSLLFLPSTGWQVVLCTWFYVCTSPSFVSMYAMSVSGFLKDLVQHVMLSTSSKGKLYLKTGSSFCKPEVFVLLTGRLVLGTGKYALETKSLLWKPKACLEIKSWFGKPKSRFFKPNALLGNWYCLCVDVRVCGCVGVQMCRCVDA